jgi:ribulose-5-phosphate 4-epimerase/fuculose-1-phosphate aldolase
LTVSDELRREIRAATDDVVAASRLLGSRQYHVALAGNVSAQISDDLLICTRHGADKEVLKLEDWCCATGAAVSSMAPGSLPRK